MDVLLPQYFVGRQLVILPPPDDSWGVPSHIYLPHIYLSPILNKCASWKPASLRIAVVRPELLEAFNILRTHMPMLPNKVIVPLLLDIRTRSYIF